MFETPFTDKHIQSGQSLVEALFAMAIFTIGMTVIGYLFISSTVSFDESLNQMQARLLTAEGIEAINSIRSDGFDELVVGTHGLIFKNGHWALSTTSEIQAGFDRTVMITDTDVDTKHVLSETKWIGRNGEQKSVSYATEMTNWMQTGGEAGDLSIDIVNAKILTGTTLTGLHLSNSGEDIITITGINVKAIVPVSIQQVTLDGVLVFFASTSDPVLLEEQEIEITEYEIGAFPWFHEVSIMFLGADITGQKFILQFVCEDGSVRSVFVIPK